MKREPIEKEPGDNGKTNSIEDIVKMTKNGSDSPESKNTFIFCGICLE